LVLRGVIETFPSGFGLLLPKTANVSRSRGNSADLPYSVFSKLLASQPTTGIKMDMLNEPVRVWHLLTVLVVVCLAWASLQKQIAAVGKCVVDMWEKFLPYKHDDL
jgi:hypothetical protein